MMYSQHGEEHAILASLERRGITNGRFLDIGAFDGVTYSNARALAEKGWSGVFVEPNPFAASKLVRLYAGDPNHVVVLAAVNAHPDLAPMALSDHDVEGLSTFDEAYHDKWQHLANFRRAVVPVITWDDLMDVVCPESAPPEAAFSVVSIDTEGLSLMLLLHMPETVRPAVICIEKDSEAVRDSVLAELSRRHYVLIYESLENIVAERVD